MTWVWFYAPIFAIAVILAVVSWRRMRPGFAGSVRFARSMFAVACVALLASLVLLALTIGNVT